MELSSFQSCMHFVCAIRSYQLVSTIKFRFVFGTHTHTQYVFAFVGCGKDGKWFSLWSELGGGACVCLALRSLCCFKSMNFKCISSWWPIHEAEMNYGRINVVCKCVLWPQAKLTSRKPHMRGFKRQQYIYIGASRALGQPLTHTHTIHSIGFELSELMRNNTNVVFHFNQKFRQTIMNWPPMLFIISQNQFSIHMPSVSVRVCACVPILYHWWLTILF